MTRPNFYFIFLLINIIFFSVTATAQTVNFEETWKEFLENNKISNMSALNKPHKVYDKQNYAKYLLMNTNSSFCQSELNKAEDLMAEINTLDPRTYQSIPKFIVKKDDLASKINAYHSMDVIWNRFLDTKDVTEEELEAVEAAQSSCEKRTLAKYSYMTAHYHLCQGDVERSKNIFENRTLRLAEKTTLRVKDVRGLASEVRKMKTLYTNIPKLEKAWDNYLRSDESNGFDLDLPLFPCNPIPNIKAFVLKGIFDVCNSGPEMLANIDKLQAKSGVTLDREIDDKVKELEAAIGQKEDDLANLNKAWEAFIPENQVLHTYGYEFCSKQPLIKAYIMDGFTFVCEMAEESLQKINAFPRSELNKLDDVTKSKINELADLYSLYQDNGEEIENIWNQFVANGDKLAYEYESSDLYCDNIHKVKDWTMQGLSVSCEEGIGYLEKIEEFNRTFEFKFYEGLECRVQQLRIKIWDCRHQALNDIAQLEATPIAQKEKLDALMEEYGMDDRPEVCNLSR